MTPFVVFLGAGLGGVARYALGGWIQDHAGSSFPWGTLVINTTGSFALAMIYSLLEGTSASQQWRAFAGIGVLGGYTTFSTFSYETIRLVQDAQWNRAALYVVASVGVSLIGAVAGFGIGAAILKKG
jgi:CrcB protein